MRFNSLIYVAFLVAVVAVLWLLPARARKWWLLGTSYAFYASWHWPYLLLLVGSATLTHVGARWIAQVKERRFRSGVIIGANLAILCAFKYLGWLSGSLSGLLGLVGVAPLPMPAWVLPLGVSFYLFESISYLVDLARKREGLHSFWDFQLFIAFFPKLIAGPILRAKELLPQFKKPRGLGLDDVRAGLWLVVSGLFCKIVLADAIAPEVDRAFARAPNALGATDVLLMGAAFGVQIYLDFASYSRIAIGSARLLGITLVDNFNYPYSSTSPTDFWARWHMSLSRWIRDYLFFPLVGKRTSLAAMCQAALITMTLCGIWHGAGWTFVAWGVYHGVLVAGTHVVHHLRRPEGGAPPPSPPRWPLRALAVGCTFGLVAIGWVFFRAVDLGQAGALLARAATPWAHLHRSLSGTFYLQTALLLGCIWLAPHVARGWDALRVRPAVKRAWPVVAVAQGLLVGLMLVLALIYLRGQTAFIYFQF